MGDLAAPAPRVNGELLSRFIGRKVLLLGKAESLDSGVMQLRTSDNRLVRVALKGNAANYTSDFVEFEAIVDSADGVNEVEHSNFGSAFDLANYNDLVLLIHGKAQTLFF